VALLVGRGGVEQRRADGKLEGSLRAPIWGDGGGVALSHDGKLVAQASGQLRVWETGTGRQIARWGVSVTPLWQAAFTPDPDVVVVLGAASFALLEVSTGRRIGEEHGTGTTATFPSSISGDGRWVGAGAAAGHVASVWSTLPYRHAIDLAFARDCGNHTAPSFDADNRRATAWSNGETLIYEIGTWKRLGSRRPHSQEVGWLTGDREGKLAVDIDSTRHEGTLVDVATGKKLARLEGEVHGPVAFSTDGKLLAEAAGKELLVRSTRDGKITARVPSGG